MYAILLFLHSALRWIILLLLVVNIIRLYSGNAKLSLSKWLLIATHLTFVIGIAQYFMGSMGFHLFQSFDTSTVMKTGAYRFWAIEHPVGMLASVVFITVGHVSLKKTGKAKRSATFYLIALVLILAVIPWPNREVVGRPLVPSLQTNEAPQSGM